MILPQKTRIPSHVLRYAAWQASGSQLSKDVWIEQKMHQFTRMLGNRRRTGFNQALFDQYLTEGKT